MSIYFILSLRLLFREIEDRLPGALLGDHDFSKTAGWEGRVGVDMINVGMYEIFNE